MVSALHIRNYALIKELEIEFGQGLNILTGETGAGKSIIIGALGLILGDRADASAYEGHDEKCVIEGHIDIKGRGLEPFFEDNDLDYDDETILRREITTSGKSRAFVNDVPVTLQLLKSLGMQLVDIHSQHSNLLLKDEKFRKGFLDQVSGNEQLLHDYSQYFQQLKALQSELAALKEKEAGLRMSADFNRFQLDEIESINLVDGEYEENEKELDKLNNSEKLNEAFSQSTHLLDESETSVLSLLNEVLHSLQKVRRYDDKIEELAARIDSNLLDLKDVSAELSSLAENWHFDEARLQHLNERQEKIYRLLRKHSLNDADELLSKADELRQAVDGIENIDNEIERVEDALGAVETKARDIAVQISEQRKKAAPIVSAEMELSLKELGMPDAQFQVAVSTGEQLKPSGLDDIQFLFTANKGKSLSEVSKVASGGEISRIMLSIKARMSDAKAQASLVFDEIDLGISGEVAIKMGQLIRELADGRQVLCITHLPQIAAMGQSHYKVRKLSDDRQTLSTIDRLNESDRIKEISEMIGGQQASEKAVESAKELLQKFAGTITH